MSAALLVITEMVLFIALKLASFSPECHPDCVPPKECFSFGSPRKTGSDNELKPGA